MDSHKIKIFYDYQTFSIQKYGGVSRLFSELIKAYNVDQDIDCYLSSRFSNNEYLVDMNLKNLKQTGLDTKLTKKIPTLINHIGAISDLLTRDYDVFHPTYYSPYFLQFLKSHPFVLTVHDMTHELIPKYFGKHDKTILNKSKLIPKAKKIIAVSENTKADILRFYDIDPNKIEVIYNGSSLQPYLGKRQFVQIPQKYLFYQGVRAGHKNFNKFLVSISELLKTDSELYLVCYGATEFNQEEVELIQDLGIDSKVLHFKYKDDEELAYLYQNCLAFVFPSLYEGFGILLLEAMSCGAPMIISDRSSFPEIAKDCAIYFDPTNESSMRDSVNRVVQDKRLREQLVSNGDKRIKDFSWKETARKTKLVYDEVMDK